MVVAGCILTVLGHGHSPAHWHMGYRWWGLGWGRHRFSGKQVCHKARGWGHTITIVWQAGKAYVRVGVTSPRHNGIRHTVPPKHRHNTNWENKKVGRHIRLNNKA